MEAYLDYDKFKDYLGKYCREERQFAVFLYNYLKSHTDLQDEVVKCCLDLEDGIEGEIKDVYFEAALMRDYYHDADAENKKEFNKSLLNFCVGWLEKENEETPKLLTKRLIENFLTRLEDDNAQPSYNLGQKVAKAAMKDMFISTEEIKVLLEKKEMDIQHARAKASFDIASMMMNATLDLLVVYEVNEKTYVKALECKYESEEGRYEDIAGVKCRMQLFIQECVMSFLFGKRKKLVDGRDDTDGIEEHLPPYPGKSKNAIWYEEDTKEDTKWHKICDYVYRGILEQARESDDIFNTGVEMIQFRKPSDARKEKELRIKINHEIEIVDARAEKITNHK